jgi:thiosulfate dehydrogenase (quinone) large subunit
MRLPGSILQGILARAALTLLRIYLGMVFLLSAWPKVKGDFTPSLLVFLERAGQTAHPFYQDFMNRVLVPNTPILGGLVAWGELLVGMTLLLGLLTRLSAMVALLLSLNSMLAQGAWLWTPSSPDAAFACIALALTIGAAGRTLGVDTFLARRWPRSPFW